LDIRRPQELSTVPKEFYGFDQSFEVEFFDMVRSTMVKYSLQARIGKMAGIFVASHNISKFLSFEYLSLEEMDQCLYFNQTTANLLFENSISFLLSLLERIKKDFPGQPLRIVVNPLMKQRILQVFVELMKSESEITQTYSNPSEIKNSVHLYIVEASVQFKNGANQGKSCHPFVFHPNEEIEVFASFTRLQNSSIPSLYFDYLSVSQ